MFAYTFFALTRQQLKTENNNLNIYTQYLMKSTFETIWLFFHRPVGLVELLILYVCVQFYTPRASDYRLISKTVIGILMFVRPSVRHTFGFRIIIKSFQTFTLYHKIQVKFDYTVFHIYSWWVMALFLLENILFRFVDDI